MKKLVLFFFLLVFSVHTSKAQPSTSADHERRIKALETTIGELTGKLNAVSTENQRLRNTVANHTIKMLQSYPISVPSNIRNSWADVKFKPGELEITQLKVPTDGEYLLLANLKVTGAQSSDEEFQLQVLRVNDNDALIDESTVYEKSNSTVETQKGELASWTIVTLKKDQLIRLRYRMRGATSTISYSYSHAKLALIKL